MEDSFRVAAVQMVSSPQLEDNLARAYALLKKARQQGAELVVLPENFALFSSAQLVDYARAECEASGAIRSLLSRSARELGIWLVGGAIPIADSPDPQRVYSSCLIYDDKGELRARYNKIHLFDVDVADATGSYRESASYYPGSEVALVETPFGRMGVGICYDLRFPELFRQLFNLGAELVVLPSAFTRVTGQAHWMPLLRARAIENQCTLIAANQGGIHDPLRETYGHSCIISGWGRC
ncbi:carbon-nitrogen hydrolase family protein [Dongshaea marina]|uniref:carbon-nitrogen hydrolase family protein n=1 Tax=Dongshaea marina TaxID=2047966 RepID=UPI001F29CD3E|nr:carbon-nitrogen hydrolase family protein [Dongshaea marina]